MWGQVWRVFAEKQQLQDQNPVAASFTGDMAEEPADPAPSAFTGWRARMNHPMSVDVSGLLAPEAEGSAIEWLSKIGIYHLDALLESAGKVRIPPPPSPTPVSQQPPIHLIHGKMTEAGAAGEGRKHKASCRGPEPHEGAVSQGHVDRGRPAAQAHARLVEHSFAGRRPGCCGWGGRGGEAGAAR